MPVLEMTFNIALFDHFSLHIKHCGKPAPLEVKANEDIHVESSFFGNFFVVSFVVHTL